jgi:hypothetical protein
MTNRAYAKNKGDGLLCSILWLQCPSVDLFDYLQKIFNVLLRSEKVKYFFHSCLLLASINLTCNFNNFVRQITLSVIITLFQGLELIVQLS